MKIRQGFVSNSSSSSFVIVSARGDSVENSTIILEDGDTDMGWCGSATMQIDELIQKLTDAKNAGNTYVVFEHGGGYEG